MNLWPLLAIVALAAQPLIAADTDLAAASVNDIGIDLVRDLAKSESNLCLSPYSIQSGLAMMYAGADGRTAAEMAKILHFSKDADATSSSFASLAQGLNIAIAASAKDVKESRSQRGDREPIALDLVSRLFGQQNVDFKKPFLRILSQEWHAPLEKLNFAVEPERARQKINASVKRQTHDRIEDLIPENAISNDTGLILAGALYVKLPWEQPFVAAKTQPHPFHVDGGIEVNVPTMTEKALPTYFRDDGFSAIGLDFSGIDLRFLILLPDKTSSPAEVAAKLSSAKLTALAKVKHREIIVVHLPKFKLKSPSMPLRASLERMGLETIFDNPPGSANLAKMAPRRADNYLYLSGIFHKTSFDLNENGAEAAAGTDEDIATTIGIDLVEPMEIYVDRPFLFAIQHVRSGACLFLGQVSDPR